MSVYVDNMLTPATVGSVCSRWSHLFADSRAELHEFARALGLRPAWIQHPGARREHYDVTERKRARALALGALPITYPRGVSNLMERRRSEAVA